MKAWEIEFNTMAKAEPVLPEHTEENWLKYEEAGHAFDKKLHRDWISGVPGSLAPCQLVVAAVQAMDNRGYDVGEAEALLPEGFRCLRENDVMGLNVVTARIYAALSRAPKDPSSAYWTFKEYLSFDDVKAEVDFGPAAYSPAADSDFPAKIKNAWLAQVIGSSAGTQMEGYTTANIIKTYGDINGYLRAPETYNDDLTYSIAFLDGFKKHGYAITSEDIALTWAALIPDGYSAEETALTNIRAGVMPPESGRARNWFSDWIGAQMRTAVHGLAAPGNPALAAELAWRDSVVSHANNGALGGVFNALLASLAFVETDVRKVVERAVSMIPAKSEYFAVVKGALDECAQRPDWLETWAILEERYKKYHWIHAYPNAAAEVVALYYGEGDFDRTINIICQAGRDTDCNAGQILTVLGIMDKPINEKWIKPLNNTVKTFMRDYREFTIDFLADLTVESVRKAFHEI
ncbi:ADP-ribosylglycohydrolase family protein [Deltaproteobacteria bacterium Smac51]|nr:ADP-ribosylglycohydrolase family protein [Deltaproteobacteria bacterium Smac51]